MLYMGPKVVLRRRIALFSGQLIPLHRRGVVLRHAFAIAVHEAEVELHLRCALLSG